MPAPRATGSRPLGIPTRGTTAPNRLRRVDRWLAGTYAGLLRSADDPLVVDLGYGASPVTTVELAARLQRVRPDVEVVGVEIDPERVAVAQPLARPGLSFRRGGFELALGGRRPVLVRALNVLRQYDEAAAWDAWRTVQARLAPAGVLVDGTCDEIGRRAAWVAVTADGPRTLTLAARLAGLGRPSDLAERLPKALIHRNVEGEAVFAFLRAFDAAWDAAAPYASLGARQRWSRACATLRGTGWPVTDRPGRWRLGEVTLDWRAVAPR
ncbi:class I SAM-dependent methyltransferase [Motilibacter aurantiacus]|uniref:class I SAM-dependent methyltransferase n=1 Tax=Motilibacter aurantiacus TaxID=2714955 RepID=UPI001407F78E|nr:class I SAM-dependent methyltransferase [Motilibacter aurantiacus]NHC46838.1 class I SAM-dependent methyltransferase [Motilibacter aurantiacus]